MSRGRWYKAPAASKDDQQTTKPKTYPAENSFKRNNQATRYARKQTTSFEKKASKLTPLPSEYDMWNVWGLRELKDLCAERNLSTNHNRYKVINRLLKWADNQRFQVKTRKQGVVRPRQSRPMRVQNMERIEKKRSPAPSICSESVSSENIEVFSTVPSFSFSVKERATEPYFVPGRTYYTTRATKVRMQKTFWNDESPVIFHLEDATRVHVDRFEVVEKFNSGRYVTRAHITSPVQGWISAYSAPPCRNNSIRAGGVLLSRELPKHV